MDAVLQGLHLAGLLNRCQLIAPQPASEEQLLRVHTPAYLAQVQERFPAPAGARSVLLGFSQGVATAARWAAAGGGPFERLILWAGVFPPDVDLGPDAAALRPLPIDCVLGDADPFFGEGLLDDTDARFREAGLTVRTTRFSGGHAICPTTLVQLL